jgi:hypothetical protein
VIRLLLLVAIGLGVAGFLYWFKRTPAPKVARALRKAALWGLVAGLVLAAATGRLNPLFALLGALLPAFLRLVQLARALPLIQRLLQSLGVNLPGGGFGGLGGFGGPGGHGASARAGSAGTENAGPQVSAIRTRFLAMRLDHATGAMDGEVLSGPFAGRQLRDLDLDSLMRMLELYRESDGQSASLLETFLDRERGADWRNRDPGGRSKPEGGPMAEPEAWSILGLKPGSDAGAIRAAHRRLMQKLHPDRGGSDYLAAKINEAKRILLKERA